MKNIHLVDHPLVQHKLSLMRDENTPPALFRLLLKEISYLLGYEATRDLAVGSYDVKTPLETMTAPTLRDSKIVLFSILRAGDGLLTGLHELIPAASVGHVGLYRDAETLEAVEYYFNAPSDLENSVNLVVDPMLATGHSSVAALTRIKQAGAKNIRFICLLCAPEGVAAINDAHPDVEIYTGSIDRELNEKGYILPGLGDAGDRIFGTDH